MSTLGDIADRMASLVAEGARWPNEVVLHPDTLRELVEELAVGLSHSNGKRALLGIPFHVDPELDGRFAFLYR